MLLIDINELYKFSKYLTDQDDNLLLINPPAVENKIVKI